jgi:hypothetical protein
MGIPAGAILEVVIPHPSGETVALYDVSALLPTKKGRPQPARPAGAKVRRLYVHKSGGEGGPGLPGILGMTRFVVQKRMFPGAPYTFWAATAPERDTEGRLVLYRLVADDRRSWHTGGVCNDHGVSLALQGNLSRRELTRDQRIVAESCVTYVTTSGRYPDLDTAAPVSTHSRAKTFGAKKSKSICPGSYAEAWLWPHLRQLGLTT